MPCIYVIIYPSKNVDKTHTPWRFLLGSPLIGFFEEICCKYRDINSTSKLILYFIEQVEKKKIKMGKREKNESENDIRSQKKTAPIAISRGKKTRNSTEMDLIHILTIFFFSIV